MELVLVLAVVAVVVLVISAPLRHPRTDAAGTPSRPASEDSRGVLGDLEAAREAKYRELRDAELDHRTGKLSDPDYAAVDRALRGEAIEILRELDAAREPPGERGD